MKLSAWLVILTAALIVVVAGVAQASLLTEALTDAAAEMRSGHTSGVHGRIAYIHEGNIWVMCPDGSGLQRLTTSGDCSRPAWSGDGRRLVYIRTSNRHEHLWLLDVPQRNARRLTPNAGDYECPRLSPDGQWVAYIILHRDQPYQIWSGRLEKMSTDGKREVVLVNDLSAGGTLAWSPDGTRVLFSEGGENQRLSMADAVNGGRLGGTVYRHPITSTASAFTGLHWVDAGTAVLFVETPMDLAHVDSYAVRRLDLSTGEVRELYADRSASQIFTMCCDGSGKNIWLGTPYPRYAQVKGIFHLTEGRLGRRHEEGGEPAYTASSD